MSLPKSKTNMLLKKWYTLLLLGFMGACTPDADLELPMVQLFSPQQNQIYTNTQPLYVSLSCTDDVSLYDYKIAIGTPDTTLTEPWDTLISKTINGQSTQIDWQIDMPNNLQNATYYLSTFCTDRIDQISDTSKVSFRLVNKNDTIAPTVNISSPNISNTVNVFSGGTLILIGTATDNVGLLDMKVYFQSADIPFQYPNHTPMRYVKLNNQSVHQITEIINIPQQEGFYLLHFVLRDAVNNITTVPIVLKVL